MVIPKLVFGCDMDDTLNNTHGFIYKTMLKFYTERGYKSKAQYIQSEWMKGTSSLDWKLDVRADIDEFCIKNHSYIYNAIETELLTSGFIDILRYLKELYDDHFKPVIITHRGADPLIKEMTGQWLSERELDFVFEEIHALDPKDHPNKIDYLKETYPGSQIRILDDNPLGRSKTGEVYQRHPELIIYDHISNLKEYENQVKYQGAPWILGTFERLLRE